MKLPPLKLTVLRFDKNFPGLNDSGVKIMNRTRTLLWLVLFSFSLMSLNFGPSSLAKDEATKYQIDTAAQGFDITIPLGKYGNRPTIDLMINGQGPYSFILDTGAMASLIDDSLVKSLDLPLKRKTQLNAVGEGTLPSGFYALESVSVGGLEVSIRGASSIDLLGMLPPGEDRPLGVVSYWQIGTGVSTLDFSANTLTLSPNAALDKSQPGTIALQQPPGVFFPVFEINLAGKSMLAEIDTGSPEAIIVDIKESKILPLKGELVEVGSVFTVGGEHTIYSAVLDGAAIIGNETIENPPLKFIKDLEIVNLGNAFFANKLLHIDHKNRLIRIEEKPTA